MLFFIQPNMVSMIENFPRNRTEWKHFLALPSIIIGHLIDTILLPLSCKLAKLAQTVYNLYSKSCNIQTQMSMLSNSLSIIVEP